MCGCCELTGGGFLFLGMKSGSELLDSPLCLSLAATNWFCFADNLGSTAPLKCVDFVLAGVLECLARASFLAIAFGAKTIGGLIIYIVIKLNCKVIE